MNAGISIIVLAVAMAGATPAIADGRDLGATADGRTETAGAELWPRWHSRWLTPMPLAALQTVSGTAESATGLNAAAALLGDVYLSDSFLGPRVQGGFRASSGVLLGTHTARARVIPAGSATSGSLWETSATQESSLAPAGSTLPYLGLGYSGLSALGGWGFTADVGIVALSPRSAVRLGRSGDNAQALEDAVRELRLSPLLRLGMAYEF